MPRTRKKKDMAELVLGVGTSHSPMLVLDGGEWLEWGANDHSSALLYDRGGRQLPYADHLAGAPSDITDRITLEQVERSCARAESALDRLRERIAEARLDVLVIVGDDQNEHLLPSNLPAFLIYHGATIRNGDLAPLDGLPPLFRKLASGYLEKDAPKDYTVNSHLAAHLISSLIADGFDMASSNELPVPSRGMGHAFSFPIRRLGSPELPMVPVIINTYTPPTQPHARRCAEFGGALRRGIDSMQADLRVGVVASGGLSHFVVMEDLDRRVLDGLARHDLDDLSAISEQVLQSGTSEIKNWIAVAGACRDKTFELVDYVPGYRTPAGTGTGLAFALWT
jgi:hypothetical protein